MLTTEQINAIRAKSGLSAKKSDSKTTQYSGRFDHLIPKKTGVEEAKEDISQTFGGIKKVYNETKDKISNIVKAETEGNQGDARSFGQAFGTIAGGVSKGLGELLTGAVKSVLPQKAEDSIKEGLVSSIEHIAPVAKKIDEAVGSPVGTFINNYKNLDDKSKRDVDSLLGISSLAIDLASFGGAKKGGEVAVDKTIETTKQIASKTVESTRKLGDNIVENTPKLLNKVKSKVESPAKSAIDTTKEVLQGETKDVVAGVKAISKIDVGNIKTYKDLSNTISKKIDTLAKNVDDVLSPDKTKLPIKELVVKAKANNKTFKSNPVVNALEHLEGLYKSTDDISSLATLNNIMSSSKRDGMTIKDINDLARLYGREFGKKAFNKKGEPLTGVNAQLYENTRKNLKTLIRNTGQGAKTEAIDLEISNLSTVKKLVDKNVEAVNKLQQKIKNRGLLEKVGHAVTKYGDLATGGTIRGLIGGLLPRGAGYKTMNALDLEEALSNNLKLIQEAIDSKSDDAIIEILNNSIKKDKPNMQKINNSKKLPQKKPNKTVPKFDQWMKQNVNKK